MGRVFRREGVEAAKRRAIAQVRADWARHPALQKFLADYFPDRWREIQVCGTRFKEWRDRNEWSRRKIQPISCHNAPYCITCVRLKAVRRVNAALNEFHRCTPKGQRPRFAHLVQTAPLAEDRTGWGLKASENHRAFAKVVWKTLEEAYGGGVGGVLSYQDFGERGFAKRHPHIDLTLNGWRLSEGGPRKTATYELKAGGADRLQAALCRRATSLDLQAADKPGNLHIQPWVTGMGEYYRTLRYQMRELVDFRKLDYSRDACLVWWMSYKENRREKMTCKEFLDGLIEYETRLGSWTKRDEHDARQSLHFRYGHMADRAIGKTEAAMGGSDIPHGRRCPCSDCGDWDRVFPDDDPNGRHDVPGSEAVGAPQRTEVSPPRVQGPSLIQ
ncbi:MAG: hypothetical protein ACYDBQ_02130 [Thermoplasmatota archaeon]